MDTPKPEQPKGRPIVTDDAAISADPSRPAFLARPADAPVYYGFPLVPESAQDGWQLGLISAFGDEEHHYGDGYVVAPDGSRCGLVWECCGGERFDEMIEPEDHRWGVYFTSLPGPLHEASDAGPYLAALMPRLEPLWRGWRER